MNNKNNKTERKINFLITYAIFSTLFISFLALSSFDKNNVEKIDEIITKKITVIGEDNLPRIVLSNENRQHPGRMDGKDFDKRERPSGIIFFNNKGDECGGIIANVNTDKNSTNSGMSFTMDNYRDDQVIQILNDETYENGQAAIQRGLTINEFPVATSIVSRNAKFENLEKIKDTNEREKRMNELWDKEGSKRRLFIGRNKNNDSGLFLYDSKGNPKMKIYVDNAGNPKIEIIDEDGNSKNIILSK